jgi:hypothetical protein
MLFLRTLDFLPADVLDVVIAADSQPDATSQPPPLKYLATICTCHALAKTMYAHAPPDFWLIWTFRCHSNTSKIIIKTPNSGFSAGVFVSVPVHGIGTGGNYNRGMGFGQRQTTLEMCL